MPADCLICSRIKLIKSQKNKYFVQELNTGYVVIGDHQYFRGYTVFLYKTHISNLHELEIAQRAIFLQEMSIVGSAVINAFKPDRLNYELLGNTHAHLHWHLIPRYKNQPLSSKSSWLTPEPVRLSKLMKEGELDLYKKMLSKSLKKQTFFNKESI